ncbi:MFS transporter (plasmid) [Cupriavidus necator]|uniref:MFS transporter n=1 Tax=Cupriavidus necator TaxID=106590 RepID=A0A367PN23_CUPNE|nr:MFS transporter [Cupriavidus necator]RCJ08446.1 MFS transporter [Cupriavidus necator]
MKSSTATLPTWNVENVAENGAVIARAGIAARIERLPANRMHMRARILIGIATFFDGFDAIAIAAALPLLIAKWSLSPAQVGMMISAGAIGALIGAFVFPAAADRYGRVRAVAWSSAIIGLATLVSPSAPTFEIFMFLRVLQGIGLGGEVPIAATYINEITSARNRGRFVLLYELIFPIGLLVSSGIGAWLVPRYGWEVMYYIGAAPLLLYLILGRLAPESPRWLAEKGRLKDADAALRRFEACARGPLAPVTMAATELEAPSMHPRRRLADLLSAPYRRRTVAVWFLWITCGFLQYGLTTWLPTIYRQVYHAPLQLSLNLALGASLLGVVGSLVCALIVDRVGRKPVVYVSFVMCALSLLMAGMFHDSSLYVVATFCAMAFGFMASGFITAYVYTPELYPTSIRAVGCGVASAWLKGASIISPMILATLLQGGRLETAFYLFAAVPFLAAVVVAAIGVETTGKSLESLEV